MILFASKQSKARMNGGFASTNRLEAKCCRCRAPSKIIRRLTRNPELLPAIVFFNTDIYSRPSPFHTSVDVTRFPIVKIDKQKRVGMRQRLSPADPCGTISLEEKLT